MPKYCISVEIWDVREGTQNNHDDDSYHGSRPPDATSCVPGCALMHCVLFHSRHNSSTETVIPHPPPHFTSCGRFTSELTNQMSLPAPKNSKWKVPVSEGTISVFKELLRLEHHEVAFHAWLRASWGYNLIILMIIM